MISVGDHVQVATDDREDGVFRVVGTGNRVALLRVTDARGRRVSTGEVVHVDREELTEGFEPARNPDETFDPVRWGRNALSGLYWSVRRFFP